MVCPVALRGVFYSLTEFALITLFVCIKYYFLMSYISICGRYNSFVLGTKKRSLSCSNVLLYSVL